MGRVYALKNVRIFYKKLGRMKFISHLDMTRVMSRLIAKSKIPVWYTEGFNQHIYMSFALPLSLGFESAYDVLDIRLVDENYSFDTCLEALKSVAPEGIEFFSISEPVMLAKDIGFADFELDFAALSDEDKANLENFLSSDTILCEKKGKKGKIKQIDLVPRIKSHFFIENMLCLRLIAGNDDNLNPTLVLDTFFEKTNTVPLFYSVTRTDILNKNEEKFI